MILTPYILITQVTEPLQQKTNEKQDKYMITPETQPELPLAVRQLLDITEETLENVQDWSPDTSKTNANKLLEETNIVTKIPVAVQKYDYPETEVKFGLIIICCHARSLVLYKNKCFVDMYIYKLHNPYYTLPKKIIF